ncbi:MAG: pantetheine-phosphate adenylyltransferase [Syntrophomonadaceae bacterium]|nr:pantetheine-phosphate adenylyltransferase [Syntrophomonadaceae bacterium]
MRAAVYAGSFDPITNGHIDILVRCSSMFDKIVVAVVHNVHKKCTFTLEERTEHIRESLSGLDNVEIVSYSGLITDLMRERGIGTIIRGLRSITDFEYESQLCFFNKHLLPQSDTIFIMADYRYSYVSSTGVKEAAILGGDISELVPDVVARGLAAKHEEMKARGLI